MNSTRDKLVWTIRVWKDLCRTFSVADFPPIPPEIDVVINKEMIKKRIKRDLLKLLMRTTKDKLVWAILIWKEFVLMSLKSEFESVRFIMEGNVHAEAKRRVRNALERRFMVSTRENLIWSLNVWKLFTVSRRSNIEDRGDIQHRIRQVLERRYLLSVKDKVSSAFHTWKLIAVKIHYEATIKVLVDEHAAMLRYLGGQMSVILKRSK